MKKLIILVTSTALSVGLTAQIDFSAPLVESPANGFFSHLITAMAAGAHGGSLNHPGAPQAPYSQFTFEYNFDGMGLPEASSGTFTTGSPPLPGGSDVALTFEHVPNFPSFVVGAGTNLDIGFIGFHAAAHNTVGIAQWPSLAEAQDLFEYSDGALDVPPVAYTIPVGPASNELLSFYAQVDYLAGGTMVPPGPHHQNDSDYWRIFQLAGPGSGDGVSEPALFVLTLEDKGTFGSDYDFDDGFFVISGFVTPVPEPSIIGLAGVMALIGFMAYRRRTNKRE